jgi:hypothetical protein
MDAHLNCIGLFLWIRIVLDLIINKERATVRLRSLAVYCSIEFIQPFKAAHSQYGHTALSMPSSDAFLIHQRPLPRIYADVQLGLGNERPTSGPRVGVAYDMVQCPNASLRPRKFRPAGRCAPAIPMFQPPFALKGYRPAWEAVHDDRVSPRTVCSGGLCTSLQCGVGGAYHFTHCPYRE